MIAPELVEVVDDFTAFGIHAFTTTRAFGSVGTATDEPVRAVIGRWDAIRAAAAERGAPRFATAAQVHGTRVLVHRPGWEGWLRGPQADGHASAERGMALGVTVADCVPVFLAHPTGAIALLHSGWRGTAHRIVEQGIAVLDRLGCHPDALRMHLGPAICGSCYQVSAEVATQLTGESASAPTRVDLRALIAGHARARGVRHITTSPRCTRCDNEKFFSHRAGDAGRQVAVLITS